MALITLAGLPAAGKSHRAAQIRDYLAENLPDFHVSILSDHSLGIAPSAYDDSPSEKPARAALFTAIQRQLATDTVLIVDSLNYIKGFRYQLYCAAREMKLRTCTVHVVATPELCRERNLLRETRYAPNTLENLFVRFEEPSSMVRWDAPLFTILWSDEHIPGPDILEAITKGNLKPPNSGTLSVPKAPTDALHVLEQTTATVVSAIVSASSAQPTGGTVIVPVGPSIKPSITLPPRTITLSEMQRLKRQFVTIHKKAITLGTTERGAVDWEEESVAVKFVAYVQDNLR
ncbi:unnamed protein product [Cyclocybe aegerita]|uniref:Chromatin associated protein KTI12 n=1 Tax=Cyclocybe aegerita TaxID=1973307 RepID=A0A8S0XI74_CYCAE|nr:unnamed protein product [Cyclocybe aegerita]